MKKTTTTKLLLATKNTKKEIKFLWNILKESKLFIIFSCLSCSIPIFYCLLSSLIKPDGSQAVMAIGYVTPFMLAFMQISFSMSMIIFSQLNKLKYEKKMKWKNEHTIMSSAIWMSFFLGLIMVVFYLISSFLYMYFANNRPNTQMTMFYGFDYIYTTIPFIILLPVFTTLLFYIYYKNVNLSIYITLIFFGLIILFSYLFGNVFDWKIKGIGIGTTLAIIFVLSFMFYYVKIKKGVIIYYPSQVHHFNLMIIKVVMKESLTSISLSIFKGIAIVCLSFVIPLSISGFVPLPYQMSRVLWFNMMYFIPCIGIGVGEAVRAHYLTHFEGNKCNVKHAKKDDILIISTTFIITILISIGCVYMVSPLTVLYVKNDYTKFENGKMPEISGWGTPTIAPNEIVELNKLSDVQWIEFPQLKPLKPLTGIPWKDAIIKAQNAAITLENLKKIENWTNQMITNNSQEVEYIIRNVSEWYKWLNQTNDQGQTIIQFIETKYQLDGTFKNIFDSLAAKNELWKNELNKFAPVMKQGLSYFVYAWLYSSTNSVVSESFINMRDLLNYTDLISKYSNVKDLLLENKISDILPSLFLRIQTFNSKSMIYICIFSSLNSVWAILLQTNARNFKKGMPYWLMTIVYFVCIGGLVTFGALFGVILKDQLGNSNPFQYLDAWTFPLIVIAFFAIMVVGLRAFRSYKFVEENWSKEELLINNANNKTKSFEFKIEDEDEQKINFEYKE